MTNKTPDLILRENRATGWTRIEVYGDEQKGRMLISEARKVLGEVRLRNGVDDGSPGFFHGWRRLADGTLVHAMTNSGHDTVRIYPVVTKKNPQRKPRLREIEEKRLCVVGTAIDDETGYMHPWLWTRQGGLVEVGLPPGSLSGTGLAVSEDGRYVVGAFLREDGFTWGSYRWRRGDGGQTGSVLDLGMDGFEGAGATDIDEKGHTIVGTALVSLDEGYGHYVWTRDGGGVFLPDSIGAGLTYPAYISSTGEFIAGVHMFDGGYRSYIEVFEDGVIHLIRNPNTLRESAALWRHDENGNWNFRSLGAASSIQFRVVQERVGQYDRVVWEEPYPIIPSGVSDNGDVVGVAWTGVYVAFDGVPVNMWDDGGTPSPDLVDTTPPTDTGSATTSRISGDGRRSAANRPLPEPVVVLYDPVEGGTNFNEYGDIYAVALDGKSYAGATGERYDTGAGLTLLRRETAVPMLWTEERNYEIPILAGHSGAWATDIGVLKVTTQIEDGYDYPPEN